ncbi:MAG: cellulase family glycosylhydrolase, partial [Oscillospiraceae bacterium]
MRKLMQKGSKLLAFFVALAMTSLFCLDGSFAIETNAETILSAAQIVEEMGVGWNLGNSLDAFGAGSISGHETYWGNPVVTEDLIKAVKAKGFNTVRVPVTWYEHITVSGSTYTIDTAWLARVKQVVDYAYNNGMYVILNIHHEDWINRSDFNSSYTAMSTELKQVWTQIASYFSDYGQRLIFEGMNEPRAVGNDSINQWTGNSACYDVVNKLDADFISTVRSVDSPYKTNRLLMVPGYAASGDYGIYSSLDKDLFSDPYVAASVHAYKPYDFAMNDEADHSDFSSEYKAQLDGIFGDLRSFFTQDDIPVVIGEFSTSNYGYTAARVDWAEYYMTLAKEIGAACVLWDNNAETNSSNPSEAHGYINRSNNTWYSASESVVNKLISVRNDNSIIWGSKSSYPLYPHENFSSGTAVNLSGAVMNTSGMSGFTSGTELAIKYTSDISLKIALMNGSYQGWTELSPYDFTYTDSYTIAYVKYDDIYGAWNGANGDLAYIKVIDSDYNDVSCSVMVLNVKASHTHTLADKYSSDATGHWYACSGCSEKV